MMHAALFDFAGTLFDDTSVLTPTRLASRSAIRGRALSWARAAELCHAILAAVDSPDGRAARHGADCSPRLHHRVWTDLAAAVPGCDRVVAEAFYDCITAAESWRPYPDSAEVLTALHRAGVRIGVVSNTGWNIRRSFALAGLENLVDVFVLSCEIGMEKPDTEIFRSACTRLKVAPTDVVMVGDDPLRDGAATKVGIPVFLLPASRQQHRRGLNSVVPLLRSDGAQK